MYPVTVFGVLLGNLLTVGGEEGPQSRGGLLFGDGAAQRGDDVYPARESRGALDDDAVFVKDEHRRSAHDVEFTHQSEVSLGIYVDIRDTVDLGDQIIKQNPGRAARTAEGTRELHQSCPLAEGRTNLFDGQHPGVLTMRERAVLLGQGPRDDSGSDHRCEEPDCASHNYNRVTASKSSPGTDCP